ncbi:MAG: sugar transferase [bacterium]
MAAVKSSRRSVSDRGKMFATDVAQSSQSTFEWFLDLEHHRNLRTGGTVCVLSLDLAKFAKSGLRASLRNRCNWLEEKLIGLIQSNIRNSDISFLIDRQVKLILTDSSKEGAYCTSKRLGAVIQEVIDKQLGKQGAPRVEIQIETWGYHGKISHESVLYLNGVRKESGSGRPVEEGNNGKTRTFRTFFKCAQGQHSFSCFCKRVIDIVGAAIAIVLLCPVMLIIAAAVKLSSPGPVLFTQNRVGLNGKVFRFLKFRSMYTNADEETHRDYVTRFIKGDCLEGNGSKLYKLVNDTRVTRVGQFLRSWSLDELPQLFNVLKGDMSLVGPRPAIPYEVENYDAWHRQRLAVLPGMTGLWQVKGRSRTTFVEMVRYDIHYFKNWSLRQDLAILLQTFRAVVNREGAL